MNSIQRDGGNDPLSKGKLFPDILKHCGYHQLIFQGRISTMKDTYLMYIVFTYELLLLTCIRQISVKTDLLKLF